MRAQGAKGVISVAANVLPNEMSSMVRKALEGKYDESRVLANELFDLMDVMFIEASPAPAKRALNIMGKNVGGLRMPLKEMSEANEVVLREVLKKHGVI